MFMRRHFLSIYALSAFVALVSNPLSAETLDESVSAALSYHPQVESAVAILRSTEEAEKEEYSAYFPRVDVTASAGRVFGDNSTSRGLNVTRGEGYSHYGEGSIVARQRIFDGLETKNRVTAARAQIEATKYNVEDVRESLALRVVQTYVNLRRVQDGLKLLHGQEKTVNDYLARIETMVDDGAADEAELQQARDVQVILDNFIADYTGQARILESDFFELTGYLPETALKQPEIFLGLIPSSMEDAIAKARAHHPLISAAELQTKVSLHDVYAERSTYVPKFDGELSALKSDKGDVLGGEVEDAKALIRMNWGFDTGGAQQARIQQRTYEYKEALARVNEVERQVERSVRQAYAESETAQRQLQNQIKRHELNKKLLETYEVQFEGALISVLQLMQADNQVLLTELEISNAKSRVLLAQYGILASMGDLRKALNVEVAQGHPRHVPRQAGPQ